MRTTGRPALQRLLVRRQVREVQRRADHPFGCDTSVAVDRTFDDFAQPLALRETCALLEGEHADAWPRNRAVAIGFRAANLANVRLEAFPPLERLRRPLSPVAANACAAIHDAGNYAGDSRQKNIGLAGRAGPELSQLAVLAAAPVVAAEAVRFAVLGFLACHAQAHAGNGRCGGPRESARRIPHNASAPDRRRRRLCARLTPSFTVASI